MFENRNQLTDDAEIKKMFYMEKAKTDGKLPSPIDLSLDMTTPLMFRADLEWRDLETPPQKMKLINSGQSVVVTGQWCENTPTLAGGLLLGDYVISQVHFHWGQTDVEGSEHKISGASFPLEMHVILFRACYETQEAALHCLDGVVVVVYLARLATVSCPGLRWLSAHLPGVVQPHSSVPLAPSPLSILLVPFTKDYLAYWGAINTDRCSHPLLWLICRDPLDVSSKDLKVWRTLLDVEKRPMKSTLGPTHPAHGRTVFHVNPTSDKPYLLPQTKNLSERNCISQRHSSPQSNKQNYISNETTKLRLTTTSVSDSLVVTKGTNRALSTGRTSVSGVPSASPPGSPPIKVGSTLISKKKVIKSKNQMKNNAVVSRRYFSTNTQSNRPYYKPNIRKVEEIHNTTCAVVDNSEQTVLKRNIPDEITSTQDKFEPIKKPITEAPYPKCRQPKEGSNDPKANVKSKLPVRNVKKTTPLQSSLKFIMGNPEPNQSDTLQLKSPKLKLSHPHPDNTIQYCIQESVTCTDRRKYNHSKPLSSRDPQPSFPVSPMSRSSNLNFSTDRRQITHSKPLSSRDPRPSFPVSTRPRSSSLNFSTDRRTINDSKPLSSLDPRASLPVHTKARSSNLN